MRCINIFVAFSLAAILQHLLRIKLLFKCIGVAPFIVTSRNWKQINIIMQKYTRNFMVGNVYTVQNVVNCVCNLTPCSPSVVH